MDTRDLKDLFESPSGTRLNAATVLNHAEGRRRTRNRVAAALVAMATVVAVGVGAVYLSPMWSPTTPQPIATPAPLPSQGSNGVPAANSSAGRSSPPEVRCRVQQPASWQEVIEAQPLLEPHEFGEETLHLLQGNWVARMSEERLTLELPGQQPVPGHFTEYPGQGMVHGLVTDGRHVVFHDGFSLLTWDSANPDQKPRLLVGLTEDLPGEAYADGGHYWVIGRSSAGQDGQETSTLYHANLDAGGDLVPMTSFEEYAWLGPSVQGRAQVRRAGENALFMDPDGTSVPFDGPLGQNLVVGYHDGVYLLTTEDGGSGENNWLWSRDWSEPYPVEEARGLVGDWVVLGTDRLFNHRTGVQVQLDESLSLASGGQAPQPYLVIAHDAHAESKESGSPQRIVRVADLPEVQCER